MAHDLIDSLRAFDSCTISNAIETFKKRLRNEGFVDSSIRCLFPELGPMVGYAVTAKIRCSSPPPDGHPYLDRTDWWNYFQSIPGPRIAVIQDVDRQSGLGAFVGEIHAAILANLGCVGVVTNGSVRDLNGARASGFHLFAQNVSVSHAYAHIVDFGIAVEVGGMLVQPGDLLHGDQHGIVSVPTDIAASVPGAAADLIEWERRVLAACRSGKLSTQDLKNLVQKIF